MGGGPGGALAGREAAPRVHPQAALGQSSRLLLATPSPRARPSLPPDLVPSRPLPSLDKQPNVAGDSETRRKPPAGSCPWWSRGGPLPKGPCPRQGLRFRMTGHAPRPPALFGVDHTFPLCVPHTCPEACMGRAVGTWPWGWGPSVSHRFRHACRLDRSVVCHRELEVGRGGVREAPQHPGCAGGGRASRWPRVPLGAALHLSPCEY